MAEATAKTTGKSQQSSILSSYLRDIDFSSPLGRAEEGDLARRVRDGDLEARNELVEANLRFVVSVAKHYQGRGPELTELISAGNLGLVTAAERFDETRGIKFISYAVWWVRQSILQTLMEQSAVRLPSNRQGLVTKINRVLDQLKQDGDSTSLEKVAEVLDCPVQMVEEAMLSSRPARSLDMPLENREDQGLVESLSDEDRGTVEDKVLDFSLGEDIESVLAELKPREATILRLYYGLGSDHGMTLGEIGTLHGLTRERIRQIRDAALAKLRHPRFGSRLRPWEER